MMLSITSALGKAAEQQDVKVFNIRAQQADKGLKTFGRQADVTVLYRFEVIKKHQTNQLVGKYTVAQAMDILLRDTQLTAHFDQSGNLLIKQKQQSQLEDKNMIPGTKQTLIATAIAASLTPVAYAEEGKKSDETEIIEVRGIRGSLAKAQQIKRTADSVVDAITVEDLGKFSDDSVADSLSRVPGVQIDSNDDGRDGARISIRGLGSEFSTTTVNGRTVYSAGAEGQRELRSFSYDTLPSEVFNEIVVRKTPTADIVGAGIAGQVDIRTLQPLKAAPLKEQNFYAVGTATYQDHSLAGDGTKFSGIIGGKNDAGTVGWYISAVKGGTRTGTIGNEFEAITRDATITIGSTTYENVRAPIQVSVESLFEKQDREVVVAAFEWIASDNFSLVADINYSDYTREAVRERTALYTRAGGPATGSAILSHPHFAAGGAEVITDEFGTNMLTYADFGQVVSYGNGCSLSDCAPFAEINPLLFDHFTETAMGGVKFDWQASDKLNVQADVYFSTVEFLQDLAVSPPAVSIPDWSYDTRGGGAAIHNIGIDPNVRRDDTQFQFATWNRNFPLDVDSTGVALDFDYDLDGEVLQSIEFGLRTTDTDFERSESFGFRLEFDQNAEAAQEALYNAVFSGNRIPTDFGFDLVQADLAGIRAAMALGLSSDSYNNTNLRDEFNQGGVLDSNEKTLALYTEVNGEFEMGSMPASFNMGVRAVKTDYEASGPALVNGSQGSLSSDTGWELLPSINMNIELNEDVNLRMGFGRTVSAPDVSDLVKATTVDRKIPTEDPNLPYTASGGNLDLKPMSGWTFDTTLEWYTANDGTVVLSYFYKDIQDFVTNDRFFANLPAPEGDAFATQGALVNTIVSGPVNFTNGDASGFEFGFNQPLTILSDALDGFGIQSNYTYVNSGFEKNIVNSSLGLPGVSRDSFNAIFYYEKEKFGARIAYNYRSDFIASLRAPTQTSVVQEAQFTEGWDQVNASVNYDITDDITIRFTANNIFESERRDFVSSKAVYRAFYQRGRTVAASITARF